MTTKKKLAMLATMAVIAAIVVPLNYYSFKYAVHLVQDPAAVEAPIVPTTIEPQLTHAQDTWMRALEGCESRGIPEAVNPEDRDGTPSYGAWQFKPDTFWYYAELYDVDTPNLQEQIDTEPVVDGKQSLTSPSFDRKYQRLVLKQMILHRDEIKWTQQFPDCVRKLGLPPRP